MLILLRSHPLGVPGDGSEIPCFLNDAERVVHYGDSAAGEVVSMQENGTFGRRDPSTRGDWERYQRDAGANLLTYTTAQHLVPGGISFKVPYRAR